MRDAYKVLVGKSEGKRPLGRPRCGWEDSIRTHLREVARKAVDCAYLAQDRDQWRDLVDTVTNLCVP